MNGTPSPALTQEKLLEVLNSLTEEERADFLKDVAELIRVQTAYIEKAREIAEN